ncbi:unnamed protein product [Rodentolepis nana]|uniref:Uncharacterized protein n=1 Tax=Rodentolepis nana TaxID=102285 RepID=A0A0R3U0I0_RODNA|nr:unnamed protein product [Rodentolepis nana]
MRVDEPVEAGEETANSTRNEEIWEAEIERREDTDSECFSSLREFLMLERLCEEECEHPNGYHKEGKDVASGDGDHIQGKKSMSFEEFCGEAFAISPTFIEDIMEEGKISQRLEQAHEEFGKSLRLFPCYNEMVDKLEKERKGIGQGDTLSKQKRLRRKGPCKPK